ncbi:MAG: hypothetical protein ACPLKV_03030 [Minisyncoccia bacterium]
MNKFIIFWNALPTSNLKKLLISWDRFERRLLILSKNVCWVDWDPGLFIISPTLLFMAGVNFSSEKLVILRIKFLIKLGNKLYQELVIVVCELVAFWD